MAGRHQLECVKINSLGIRKKIGSLERHVVQLRMDDYVAPVEKPPKKQTSILSFATECPRGSITYRPSMPLKRPAVKRGPGRGNWKTAALLSRSRWFGDTVLGETAWTQEDGGNS